MEFSWRIRKAIKLIIVERDSNPDRLGFLAVALLVRWTTSNFNMICANCLRQHNLWTGEWDMLMRLCRDAYSSGKIRTGPCRGISYVWKVTDPFLQMWAAFRLWFFWWCTHCRCVWCTFGLWKGLVFHGIQWALPACTVQKISMFISNLSPARCQGALTLASHGQTEVVCLGCQLPCLVILHFLLLYM
jgi:hypothetical protein